MCETKEPSWWRTVIVTCTVKMNDPSWSYYIPGPVYEIDLGSMKINLALGTPECGGAQAYRVSGNVSAKSAKDSTQV